MKTGDLWWLLMYSKLECEVAVWRMICIRHLTCPLSIGSGRCEFPQIWLGAGCGWRSTGESGRRRRRPGRGLCCWRCGRDHLEGRGMMISAGCWSVSTARLGCVNYHLPTVFFFLANKLRVLFRPSIPPSLLTFSHPLWQRGKR